MSPHLDLGVPSLETLDAAAAAVGPVATIRLYGRPRLVRGILPAALVGGLALTCGVALTTTAGWLIVAASYKPQILTLLAAIVLVRAFGIARPALRYAERIRSHDAALSFLAQERAATYSRLIPLTPARLGRRSRGEVLAGVVDDLDDIAYAQVRTVVPVVALLVTGGLAAFANALFLLPAAAIVGSHVACTLLAGLAELRLERRAQRQLVAARAEVTRLATLVAGSAGDLAAIGAAPQALAWLDEAHDRLRAALTRQGYARALGVGAMPLLTLAHTAAMAAACNHWAAGLTGPIAAFLLLTPIALGEVVAGIPDAVGASARARSAGRRLDRLLRQSPAVRAPEPEPAPAAVAPVALAPPMAPAPPAGATHEGATHEGATDEGTTHGGATDDIRDGDGSRALPPELALAQVTASWDGDRAALTRFSFRFAPGRRVAVVGPNGCGKSTLLAVLARHLDPDTGSYAIDRVDVTRRPLPETRALLAVVDDEPHVFASTLRENLRFARPGCPDADVERALRLAGLQRWREGLEHGLDTHLGATGRGVSGGERARLAVARALLSERPVLLLDEPVAHLDHPTAVAVLADLWEAAAGRTVVLVAHRPEGLGEVDEVLRLGPPEEATSPPLAGPR